MQGVLWECVWKTGVVEKTACEGEYAMCDGGEVTVNGKVVIRESAVQLGRRETRFSSRREWACPGALHCFCDGCREKRCEGGHPGRVAGSREFGEEVSEQDGVEFLVGLQLCECRRTRVPQKVGAVSLVSRPVQSLASSVAVPIRTTSTASTQAPALVGREAVVASSALFGVEDDLGQTWHSHKDRPRGCSDLAHRFVSRGWMGSQDDGHRTHNCFLH